MFRQQLINDRTNKQDGVLYSEYSGKPLLQAYDIVLHHKVPLTMSNVNDVSISLNPDNIMVLSQREHNEMHARFGYTAQRKVYYVYGSPCSGKTTFVNNIKGNSDLVVDLDNIWQCITGGERYDKPNALKPIAFALRDELMELVKTRAGRWERAYVIDGGALKSDREHKIDVLGAEPIFIQETKETCLQRLTGDNNRTPEQKEQWKKYIETWFNNYTE